MTSHQVGPRAKCGRFRRLRANFALIIVVAVTAASSTLRAAERYWITSLGGSYSATGNWSATAGGAGGASVPGGSDNANFTLNSIYTVNFGAATTTTGLILNNGSVTFDLFENKHTVTGATGTRIGATSNQTGRLTVKNGTLAVDTATDRIIVGETGATGFLTISSGGRLGDGTIDPDIIVGNGGTGTFAIDDNGRADVGIVGLGQLAGAAGTLTVAGPNAMLDASETVNVGGAGNGTINIQSSGAAIAAGGVTIGSQLGANGTINLTNSGTKFTHKQWMIVGNAGDASLNIQTGALMQSIGGVLIGNLATGIGTAQVTGADTAWEMTNALQIGASGLGNFIVSTGGRVNTLGATSVAAAAGSRGNVIVSGAGSRWTAANITIGDAGEATMLINTGGVVKTGNASIGGTASGTGKVTLSGEGSTWDVSGALNIASSGNGSLTVESNASLSATGTLMIGDPAGAAVGSLQFSGGAISVGGFVRSAGGQFDWTNGTLIVNGGTFDNSGAALTINGSKLSDLPALRLASGTQVTSASVPSITIGNNRQGTLIVSGGSKLQTNSVAIGGQDTGTGSLVVEGLNSTVNVSGDVGLGGTTLTAGGLGNVTLGANGVFATGGTLRLWDGGTITISGGTLRFNSLAANGGKAVFNAGTIQTTSAFNASAAALDALLGSTHVLGTGRQLDAQTNAFNLQSNLTAIGGNISGSTLAVSANVVARFEAGATASFSAGVTNPLTARVYVTDATLAAGTTFTNGGELHLAGNTATVNATSVNNTGLVSGSGRLNSVVTNSTAGQVRVVSGQRMEVLGSSGTNVNNGLIDVDGGAIEFGRTVTNSSASPSTGLIAARNATLRFNAGLANSGAMTFTEGVSDVFGEISNQNNLATPGRIVVTGGAQANFFDDVVNNGVIQVSSTGGLAGTAVFLGSLSGNGVSGAGRVFIEGDARPGFSPGTMAFGGDVSFGPLAELAIELGGTSAGTQYDRVTVANTAALDGVLNVSLINNFKPVIGNSFQILSAAGGMAGTFSQLVLPALAGGASWNVGYTANAMTLTVGGVLGDFNLDGLVNAADYSLWRDQLGTNSLASDASGNGTVGPEDYNIWKSNFGDLAAGGGNGGGSQAVSAVPEPTALTLLALVAMTGSLVRRRTHLCQSR